MWDEVADAFGEVLGASGYAVLVAHGGLWVGVAGCVHELSDCGALLGEEGEGRVAQVVESEVRSARGLACLVVPRAQRVRADGFDHVARAGEQPRVGLRPGLLEESVEVGRVLGRDVLVADAVLGLGAADGLWSDGLAAAADVQDEMLEVDVPALQGADLADARAVAEHGDVDRVGVSGGHVVVDGLDLGHGGGHGLDLAFLTECGDHAGVGWDERALAVPAGLAGGGEHGLEDLERVDSHGALGVVQLVPPAVAVARRDVHQSHAAEIREHVVLGVLTETVHAARLQRHAALGAPLFQPCREIVAEREPRTLLLALLLTIRFLCSVRQAGIYCFASPQYHKYIEYTSIAISPITNRTFTLIINHYKQKHISFFCKLSPAKSSV